MLRVINRKGTAHNLEMDFGAAHCKTICDDVAHTSSEPRSRADLITACGQVPLKTNDPEEVRWFARILGGIIGDPARAVPTQTELGDLLSVAYNQYVIVSRLRPIMDAKPFMDEVKVGIEKAQQPSFAAQAKELRRLAAAEGVGPPAHGKPNGDGQ